MSAKDINTVKQNMLSSASIMNGTVKGTVPVVKSSIIELNVGQQYTIPKGYHDGTGKIRKVLPSTVNIIASKLVSSTVGSVDTSHGGDFNSQANTKPAIDITKYKYCTIKAKWEGGWPNGNGGLNSIYASVTAASGRIDRIDLDKKTSIAHLTGNATFYVHAQWHNSWADGFANNVWITEVTLET